jgi:hypothetical protein
MTRDHSFFLPDVEYVVDLPGLIQYLGEKVSVGNICLHCNGRGRAFHSLEAVQKHMVRVTRTRTAASAETDTVAYVFACAHAWASVFVCAGLGVCTLGRVCACVRLGWAGYCIGG